MSITGLEARAAIAAMEACTRLLSVLEEAHSRHASEAQGARVDWDGPHREEFEDRFDAIQRGLVRGMVEVAHLHQHLQRVLLDAMSDSRLHG
jgi:hypothetical protein